MAMPPAQPRRKHPLAECALVEKDSFTETTPSAALVQGTDSVPPGLINDPSILQGAAQGLHKALGSPPALLISDISAVVINALRRRQLLAPAPLTLAFQFANLTPDQVTSLTAAVTDPRFTGTFTQQLVALGFTSAWSFARSDQMGSPLEPPVAISELNACIANPCQGAAGLTTCRDQPAPAPNTPAGRNCSCARQGFVYGNDTIGCFAPPGADLNACLDFPCTNGTSVATCRDITGSAPNAPEGRNCSCNAGFTYSNDTTGCIADNVDACIQFPCTNGVVAPATCRDLPNPAPNSVAGRNCTCGTGYTYKDDVAGCIVVVVDINACVGFPCARGASNATCRDLPDINACDNPDNECGPDATCVDLPPPAPGTIFGRNCSCPVGTFYLDDEEGCVDVNACREFPCRDPLAVCSDLTAPAENGPNGRRCTCGNVALIYDEVKGCFDPRFVDIDACLSFPCTQTGLGPATCSDLLNPAPNATVGRNCTCTVPGQDYRSDALGCQDSNACTAFPCTSSRPGSTVCTDLPQPAPNSAAGRTCNCTAPGYRYQNDVQGCVGNLFDACATSPCLNLNILSPSVCTDLPGNAPATVAGRICNCSAPGYAYVENRGCMDIDACKIAPCPVSANCEDLSAPAPDGPTGRTCICRQAGLVYSEANGCFSNSSGVEVDACIPFPCTDGSDTAFCRDVVGGPNSREGRRCACSNGFTYGNDSVGCVAPEINACLQYPCRSNNSGTSSPGPPRSWLVTCTDLPNPAPNSPAGRVCTCDLTGLVYQSDAVGCTDVDACVGFPCLRQTGPQATCQDLPAPAANSTLGRTCTCPVGFTYSSEFLGCTGTGICRDLPPPAPDSRAGRNCSCEAGRYYWNDTAGCVLEDSINLVDACVSFPCRNLGGNGTDLAVCTDRVGLAPNSTEGRTCRCTRVNYFYKSEAEGCREISKLFVIISVMLRQLQKAD
eukprot:gene13895-14014_t